MSIIVGFTKMTYFGKSANLARFETMGQQNRLIVGDFRKNEPRSGKTSNEVTKRGILTKDKSRQIWRVCQKFMKGLAKYSNEMTKRGMLIVGDF